MFQRHITKHILQALSDTPVVVLHGARQTGKTTLARQIADTQHPAKYITFDDLNMLGAAQRDPAGFVAGLKGSVVLDEIQRAPELLLAIKESVDNDRQPGRFLLTGSASVMNLPRIADALVGRMELLTLWPLSQGEIAGHEEGFVDRLFSDTLLDMASTIKKEEGASWQELARAGGYPEAISRRQQDRRHSWFDAYLNTILIRDVRELSNITGLSDLPRILEVLSSRAGGLLNYADLARDAGMNQVTFKRYFTLLQAIFLVQPLQPWHSNRVKRLMKSEKLYLCDTGLLSRLLNISPNDLVRDSKVKGVMLENFVAMELMKQISWSKTRPQLHHFRDYKGNEVDFVLESGSGRKVVGIEVKASSTIGHDDCRGMRILSESLGKNFLRGVVLYAGKEVVPFADNIHAVPLKMLWTT